MSAKRREPVSRLPKWLAFVMIAVLFFLTGFLLYCGSQVVVRCDRLAEDRVDVATERRFLGLLPLRTEHVGDVVKAARVAKSKLSGAAGGKHRRSSTDKLVLTTRGGAEWHSPLYTPAFGDGPREMAPRINAFIHESSAPSLELSWFPWVVNLAALVFVLVSLLMLLALGEGLARKLGFIKPEPADRKAASHR